jgi:colicin import membrane protein
MKEWGKDQEEYTDRQFKEIEGKKKELKTQADEEAIERAELERQNRETRERFEADRQRKEKEERERKEAEEEAYRLKLKRKAAKAEAREKEEFEAKQAIRAKYFDRFSSTLKRLKEIEEELARVKVEERKRIGLGRNKKPIAAVKEGENWKQKRNDLTGSVQASITGWMMSLREVIGF